MKPELAMTIDAARDLAWRPTHNLSGGSRLADRHESHERLVDALGRGTGLSANASPELSFLVAAIRRVAACSFSNRMGLPYYERKQSVAELRGCLVAYDREAAARAMPIDRSAGPDGCWPWLGARTAQGYARRGDHRVARLVLADKLGRPLGSDEQACHTCDNPPCCNPAHLFAGSPGDNVRDMYAKGRQAAHSRPHSHCHRGHALTPDNVVVERTGRRCRTCKNAADRSPASRARERRWRRANHDRVLAIQARWRNNHRAAAAASPAGPDLASRSRGAVLKRGLVQRERPQPEPQPVAIAAS